MTLVKTIALATLAALMIWTGYAQAGTVTVQGQALAQRSIVVRKIVPHKESVAREAYGIVVRLSPLVSEVGTIRSDRALSRLDATLLKEAKALRQAPYRISAKKLATAIATANRTRTKFRSAEGALRAHYGGRFAAALIHKRQLVKHIRDGEASIVDVTFPYPLPSHPPSTAMGTTEGRPEGYKRRITLKFLGVGGRVPSNMIGQSVYYLAPRLQAGTMMRVNVKLAGRRDMRLKLPISALIFDGSKVVAFRRVAAATFRSFQVLNPRPFYKHGHIVGYQGLWASPTHGPVPVVTRGAGILWSFRGRDGKSGKRK